MQATNDDLRFNEVRQLDARQNPVTDEQLIVQYRQTGDRELFAQLVYRYERELFNYLRRYLGCAEMAEDVFQTVFLHVHLKCNQFEADRRFRPWLYSIATNAAIDARRKNQRHLAVSLDKLREQENTDFGRLINLLESGDPDPSLSAIADEASSLVRKSLDQLPETMYAVIQLVYYRGMKYQEAADVLQIPVGTVKSRLHTAIAKLTEMWNMSRID
jgi:RNA polymerase sigma-70 factor (ECF subfamily)